ncbi:MAG: ATP-binding cassette domain-containing protein, partial [Magnetococcales bacterium]|nr:ATP-binding cassette domain-containing protein [Magnetococcales bacterium]
MTRIVPLLELRGVCLCSGSQELNLTVLPGDSWVVLGEEASGKSLLMRMMVDLHRPDGGQVIRSSAAVGVLFRDPDAHFICATPAEEVALTPRSQGLRGRELTERIAGALVLAGLDERFHSGQCVERRQFGCVIMSRHSVRY